MSAADNCRACLATETGCEHVQLYRGRRCWDDCDHDRVLGDAG